MHRKTTENAVFTRNFEFIDPLRSFDRNMVFNYTNLTIRKGLYISTASIQNILNSLGVKIQNIPILNSLEELLSRSYLPKDEMDRIIKRWEVFLSYFK